MPVPGGTEDRLKGLVPGLPAKFPGDFCGGTDQACRITRATIGKNQPPRHRQSSCAPTGGAAGRSPFHRWCPTARPPGRSHGQQRDFLYALADQGHQISCRTPAWRELENPHLPQDRIPCTLRSRYTVRQGSGTSPRQTLLPVQDKFRRIHATYAQTFLNDIVTQLDIAHIQPLPSPGAIFYFVQNAAVSILQCSRHLWLPKQWAIRLGAEFHLSGTHFTIINQVFIDLQLKNLQLCQHSFLVNNESTSYAMGSNYNVGNAVGDVFDFVIICGEIRAGGLGFSEILRNWA
jgi:hypothetical protein